MAARVAPKGWLAVFHREATLGRFIGRGQVTVLCPLEIDGRPWQMLAVRVGFDCQGLAHVLFFSPVTAHRLSMCQLLLISLSVTVDLRSNLDPRQGGKVARWQG